MTNQTGTLGRSCWGIGREQAAGIPVKVVVGSPSSLICRSVLVRKSHSEYPASQGRPAIVHDELMVVYSERGHTRAVYFDNEGHVINYTPSFSPDGRTLTLVSDLASNTPTFRLTYVSTESDVLKINFEIAPPGTSTFKSYVGGVVHRTK